MAASGSRRILGIYSEGFRAGKDSFAKTWVEEFGFVHYDFSKVIKEHVWENLTQQRWPVYADWYDYCEAHKYDQPDQEGFWVRKLLQSWGQFYRSMDNMFWVNLWEQRCEERGYERVVVPSVRFADSEGLRIRQLGGITVKIERPGITVDSDPSENSMREWTPEFIVQNDGTLEDLANKARWVAGSVNNYEQYHIEPILLCPPPGITVQHALQGIVRTKEERLEALTTAILAHGANAGRALW